jgi:hypothetical protein
LCIAATNDATFATNDTNDSMATDILAWLASSLLAYVFAAWIHVGHATFIAAGSSSFDADSPASDTLGRSATQLERLVWGRTDGEARHDCMFEV